MNKQLLTALFATTFSGMMFAAEAPNYHGFPIIEREYCTAHNTKSCLEMLAFGEALLITLKEREEDTGVIGLTKEEQEQEQALKNALIEEVELFNASKKSILESAQRKAQEDVQDLSEKLNPTDSTDSKE